LGSAVMNKTYAEENAIEHQRLFMLTDKLILKGVAENSHTRRGINMD